MQVPKYITTRFWTMTISSIQAADFFGRRSVLEGMEFLCWFLISITTGFWIMTILAGTASEQFVRS